ncbi:GNAT family N-acetyltransferase [Formosa algae]|uniref:GNAT superfamily N-acetyltransferase n=1 Tax=Formosa algae TaxID=225843 RepID=A0A9X0YQG5_9FLAO|nr:GNAT family N-acetyltransferase [Formosa algae]MBP1841497.1 GNAT superfamily N-acetyltransferase [Formosa algae]MDQ0336581.1 GNAT superfamily N-acetyltransferase [Formosa algae]OEI81954.1 GNAT family N-acetyltransferase [Formosa algae]
MELLRTDSNHKDFIALVKLLDSDLAIRDGEDHAFYAQFNKIDMLKHVVIAYNNAIPVSCGAIKPFDTTSVEVKRMYTAEQSRGQGLASIVLSELEQWAKELDYTSCVLETGMQQPEAIALYHKNGYELIPNYGQYANVENSRCFKKHII